VDAPYRMVLIECRDRQVLTGQDDGRDGEQSPWKSKTGVRERSDDLRRRSISDCSREGRVIAKQIQQSMPSVRKESWTASRWAKSSLLSSAFGAGWLGSSALAIDSAAITGIAGPVGVGPGDGLDGVGDCGPQCLVEGEEGPGFLLQPGGVAGAQDPALQEGVAQREVGDLVLPARRSRW
jgi:hypothetical protein